MSSCKLCGTDENVRPELFKLCGEDIGPYCESCWSNVKICDKCGKPHSFQQDARKHGVSFYEDVGEYLCTVCRRETLHKEVTCEVCGESRSHLIDVNDGELNMCSVCVAGEMFKCELCGKYHKVSNNFWRQTDKQLIYQSIFQNTMRGVCLSCAEELPVDEVCTVHYCVNCGDPTIDYYIDNDGKKVPICSSCRVSVNECSDCGKISCNPSRLVICKGQDKSVCLSCFSNYKMCNCCGDYYSIADLSHHVNVNGSRSTLLCKECCSEFVECKRCCGVFSGRNTTEKGGNKYCLDCTSYVMLCNTCNKPTEYANGMRCRKCYAIKYNTGAISRWDWKPIFKQHKSGNSTLLFGMENELSFLTVKDTNIAIAHIYKNWPEDEVYCVHDGSIKPQGFEIVTHPRNFASIKETDWSNLFPLGARKHSSCGMHVHMSKKSFKKFHLFKFVSFIHNYPNFIRIVGQRPDSEHCTKNKEKAKHLSKYANSNSRYVNVNLQNAATVELRFFANAAEPKDLLKNIEFLKALFDFTLNNSPKNCTVSRFIKYVSKNKKDFSNLKEFFESFNLCSIFN